jgi:antirestriction protein ArdC
MRQANQLGCHVRESEVSTIVVFWQLEDLKQSSEDFEREENDAKNLQRFLLRHYRVVAAS